MYMAEKLQACRFDRPLSETIEAFKRTPRPLRRCSEQAFYDCGGIDDAGANMQAVGPDGIRQVLAGRGCLS